MAEIQKGVVSSIEGEQAGVKPLGAGTTVTHLLNFNKPATLLGDGEEKTAQYHPPLKVNDVVTYVAFPDGTGHLLGRL